MNFDWNEKTIRWYKNADRYTGFYKNVAAAVAPLLRETDTMCDLGCGLGLVDLELAGSVSRIDAVDRSLPALISLGGSLREREIKNVRPILKDVDELSGEWDVAFMSFFGSRAPERFFPRCEKLILVVCGNCRDELMPPQYRRFKKNTADHTESYLKENGVDYGVSYYEFEFGQPFESAADAFEFVSAHAKGITKSEVIDFLDRRLIRLHGGEYEYYIPRQKQIGVFEVNAAAGRKLVREAAAL